MHVRTPLLLVLVCIAGVLAHGCRTIAVDFQPPPDELGKEVAKPAQKPKPKPKPPVFKPDEKVWTLDTFRRDKLTWRVEPWANPATLAVRSWLPTSAGSPPVRLEPPKPEPHADQRCPKVAAFIGGALSTEA